jgi:hypothetical protein
MATSKAGSFSDAADSPMAARLSPEFRCGSRKRLREVSRRT